MLFAFLVFGCSFLSGFLQFCCTFYDFCNAKEGAWTKAAWTLGSDVYKFESVF